MIWSPFFKLTFSLQRALGLLVVFLVLLAIPPLLNPEVRDVIIAPYDMRKGRIAELEQSTLPWYGTLCDEIAAALRSFVHDFPD